MKAALLPLPLLLCLVLPSAALAVPSATLLDRTLTVNGGAGAQTMTIKVDSGYVMVTGVGGVNDPDDQSGVCKVDGDDADRAACFDSAVDRVVVKGGLGDDTLEETTIYLNDGDDIVTGSAGADAIYAEDGDDVITPGPGADIVYAGEGDDVVNAFDRSTDRVDCERGTDRLVADLAGAQPERADVAFDCESITGTPFGALALRDRRVPEIRVRGLRSRVSQKGGLRVRVGADEAIAAELSLRVRGVVMADASLRRSARMRTVRLRPTLRLVGPGSVRARLRIVAFDAAGNRAVKTRSIKVTARRR